MLNFTSCCCSKEAEDTTEEMHKNGDPPINYAFPQEGSALSPRPGGAQSKTVSFPPGASGKNEAKMVVPQMWDEGRQESPRSGGSEDKGRPEYTRSQAVRPTLQSATAAMAIQRARSEEAADTKADENEDSPPQNQSDTADETESRKAEPLSKLLGTFLRNAVIGCRCSYFAPGSTDRHFGVYQLNQRFDTLIVGNIQCELTDILDVYELPSDGFSCFPQPLLTQLTFEELDSFALVVYRRPLKEDAGDNAGVLGFDEYTVNKNESCVGLVVESKYDRIVFLRCLKALCARANRALR
eukprot:TRINITY_DN4870_c0_g1_i4.p1 TRINITY_DN4870_c0_g1~~TRINITY_DN4870_c0_g1_i4.p1  ORF type:complete len:297 (+),score=30.67 TRINITY_DN4870_c0_g1_i4:98-988(+)